MTSRKFFILIKQLDSIQKECSKPNWDGDDELPISKECAQAASILLRELFYHGVLHHEDVSQLPDIEPDRRGMISFHWYFPGDEGMMLSFNSKNNFFFAARSLSRGNEMLSGSLGILEEKNKLINTIHRFVATYTY